VSRNRSRRFLHDFGCKGRLEEASRHGHSGHEPMLPVTLRFIIAMIACALNERMARKARYLQEEARVFKEALATETGKTRIAFTLEQRRRLALKGKALTPEERRACCQVVRPETILARFRSSEATGRPSTRATSSLSRPWACSGRSATRCSSSWR